MHVIGLLHPRQTYLIQSRDREGTQQSFILWGGGGGERVPPEVQPPPPPPPPQRARREVQPPTLKYTVFD